MATTTTSPISAPAAAARVIEPHIPPEFTALYAEIADCPRCELARTRACTVPGSGPAQAEIMFIGEAPGQREDELGLPFVGASGRFLDELLRGIGLSREQVYIANVVKCRPPGNRDPEPEEIAACEPFLDRQIATIDPLLIVTLGRFSMQRWFAGTTISRVHGQPKRADGRMVVPMYHPAAALHRGNLRSVIEADFARLPELLTELRGEPRAELAARPEPEAAVPPAAPLAETPPAEAGQSASRQGALL